MSDVAERLRLRYPPPRVPRPVLVAVVAVGAAVGLAWLIWSASFHATPPVSAQVSAYRVVSETEIAFTLTVDRPDPSRPVVCRVLAQAQDFSPVGELQVRVPGTPAKVVNVRETLVTTRPAVTATAKGCELV